MSRSYKPTHSGGRKRGTATIALLAAAAVVVIGGVAGAVTLTGGSHGGASLTSKSSSQGGTPLGVAPGAASAAPSFTAAASPTTGRTSRASKPTSPANSPTSPASSPTAPSTTLPPSAPANSGGRTLTLSTTGVTGPWPIGQRYPGSTVRVSGGQAPYTWHTSGLPSGMTATSEGATLAISGTPTELGNFSVDVTVTDSAKPEDSGTSRLPIEVAQTQAQPQGTLRLDDSLSLTDEEGDNVDIGTTADGGIEPYTWTVTGLPSGVKASAGGAGNAAISLLGGPAFGTSPAAGTYPFTVTLSDSGQPRQTVTERYTLTILKLSSEQWSVEPLDQTQATVGIRYSGSLAATNGVTVTWAVTAGSLPPGLTLNSATGTITGTPTERGGYNFTIVATNVATGSSKQGGTYNFTVYPAGT